MKKKELSELRLKKISDLTKLADEKKTELYKILAKIKAGKEKNLRKASTIRHDLAQIKTVITQMEIIGKEKSK